MIFLFYTMLKAQTFLSRALYFGKTHLKLNLSRHYFKKHKLFANGGFKFNKKCTFSTFGADAAIMLRKYRIFGATEP